jgi:putative nucleotidyltransferase with HDIG domain
MSLKESDEYDYSHGINVAIYSLMVGIQMGYNRATLTDLGIGALLHDIGKLALDQTIISKPSTLTYEEYEYVKRHSLEGFNMVKNLDLPNISKNIVLQHHENYDGSGYPLGVTNASLSPLVKIVSICDVYDAMTSDRVYMTKKDPYTSISTIISETNRKFDPVLVSNFIKTIGIYPIGMNLTLNTGEIGVVIEKRKHKPTVKVTIDRNGKLVDGYYVVELQNNPKIKVVKINIEEKSA